MTRGRRPQGGRGLGQSREDWRGRGNVTRSRALRPKVVYEDRDILVIDKPAGLLAVPIPGSRAPNAQEILARSLAGERLSVLPVHRIDRYTSGLMVFARSRLARSHMVKKFLAHEPLRLYLAVVRGRVHEQEGELRHFLKKVSWGFRQVVVPGEREGGALAVTRYRVLERFQGAALLEAQLVTGLKNQIGFNWPPLECPSGEIATTSPVRETPREWVGRPCMQAGLASCIPGSRLTWSSRPILPRTSLGYWASCAHPRIFEKPIEPALTARCGPGIAFRAEGCLQVAFSVESSTGGCSHGERQGRGQEA